MKSTRKFAWKRRSIGQGIAFAVVGLLLSSLVLAQPRERVQGGHAKAGGELKAMERLLDLSESQIAELEVIFADRSDLAEGSRDEHKANAEALRAELERENPDATTVGRLVIAGHQLRGASKASFEATKANVAEVLTDEQLATWEGFQKGRHTRGRDKGRRSGPGSRTGERSVGGSAPRA